MLVRGRDVLWEGRGNSLGLLVRGLVFRICVDAGPITASFYGFDRGWITRVRKENKRGGEERETRGEE
jgi:hypothetical protein